MTNGSPGAPRRLLRSRSDRLIAGVCGGLGHYLGIDPVWVRVATILIILLPGIGIVAVGIAYLVGVVVVPEEQAPEPLPQGGTASAAAAHHTQAPPPPSPSRPPDDGRDQGRLLVGGFLVALGTVLLARIYLPEIFTVAVIGPIVLIALGVLVVAQGLRR